MNRLLALALLFACPAAYAQQSDYAEGVRLAEAFSQADLDALGRCHARIEGAGLILKDLEGWLVAQNQTEVLQALRKQVEGGTPVLTSFAEVRHQTAKAEGMNLAKSDSARTQMLETFKRQSGEDERAFYTRAQPETKLPQECRDALKRGRWKVEIEELAWKE